MDRARIYRFVAIGAAGVGFVLGVVTSAGPNATEANVCEWVRLFASDASDTCLRGFPVAWLQWLAVVLVVCGLGWLLRRPIRAAGLHALLWLSDLVGLRVNGHWMWRLRTPWERTIQPVQTEPSEPIPEPNIAWSGASADVIANCILEIDRLIAMPISSAAEVSNLSKVYQAFKAEIVDYVRGFDATKAYHLTEFGPYIVTPDPDTFNHDHNHVLHNMRLLRQNLKRLHRDLEFDLTLRSPIDDLKIEVESKIGFAPRVLSDDPIVINQIGNWIAFQETLGLPVTYRMLKVFNSIGDRVNTTPEWLNDGGTIQGLEVSKFKLPAIPIDPPVALYGYGPAKFEGILAFEVEIGRPNSAKRVEKREYVLRIDVWREDDQVKVSTTSTLRDREAKSPARI